MTTLTINSRSYNVISFVVTDGGNLQVYECWECGALVADPDLHNEWHSER